MPEAPDERFPATRRSLLARLKNREDQTGWRQFFDTYWNLIYRTACKAGLNDDEAQEVVQETVLAVVKHAGHFRYDPQVCAFKTWLLRMVRWRINDQFRARRKAAGFSDNSSETTAPTMDLDAVSAGAAGDLEAVWEAEWTENLIQTASQRVKRQVNSKQYQIFDLHVQKGWPVREVAQALKVNAGRVYLAKHRVGSLLKREIARLKEEFR